MLDLSRILAALQLHFLLCHERSGRPETFVHGAEGEDSLLWTAIDTFFC